MEMAWSGNGMEMNGMEMNGMDGNEWNGWKIRAFLNWHVQHRA